MDHSYAATTVEMDTVGFDDLQTQLINNKYQKVESQDIREKVEKKEPEAIQAKRYAFKKGDQSVELDDDYELEFMADKRPIRLTLKELKDRAAGDIAVKNRMHSLAEEKKKVTATLSQFATLAKTDPLAALEYISNKAKETDSDFEYSKYIEKLADQAEKLGQMDDKDRKAWELQKKLEKAEQDLSQKEQVEAVVLRKQKILEEYPEIGDQQFGDMVNTILENEDLLDGAETADEVFDRAEQLIQETLIQKDIMSVINEVNPSHINNTNLIFSLSDQIRQNPDLDEEDVRDIIRELIGSGQTIQAREKTQRERDIATLSGKARQSAPINNLRNQNASPYDLLAQKLKENKSLISKTPLYAR